MRWCSPTPTHCTTLSYSSAATRTNEANKSHANFSRYFQEKNVSPSKTVVVGLSWLALLPRLTTRSPRVSS